VEVGATAASVPAGARTRPTASWRFASTDRLTPILTGFTTVAIVSPFLNSVAPEAGQVQGAGVEAGVAGAVT